MAGTPTPGRPSPSLSAPNTAPLPTFTPIITPIRAQTLTHPSPQSMSLSNIPIPQHLLVSNAVQAVVVSTALPAALTARTGHAQIPQPPLDLESQSHSANPVGIEERLDELKHMGGCRTRIQWSPTGTLAAISPNSRSVGLYHFWADPSDREWKLSDRIPLSIPHNPHQNAPHKFCHLQWNDIGQILALGEASGSLRLFSTPSSSRGHMMMSKIHTLKKPPPSDPKVRSIHDSTFEIDPDPIVLLHWLPVLPTNAKTTILWTGSNTHSETEDLGDWKYDFFNQYAIGPASPFEGMGSLICIHRSGKVRLVFQASAHDWMQSTTFLASSDLDLGLIIGPIILHAAVAPRNAADKDPHLVLATFDGKMLRIFRVQTIWPSKVSPDPNNAQTEDMATLDVKCLLSTPFPPKKMAGMQLVHLALLAAAPKSPIEEDARTEDIHPVLVASFHGLSATGQDCSITATWDVLLSESNGNDTSLPDKCTLRPQGAHRSSSAVIHISRPRFDTVMAVCYADGSIEFRDRQLRLLKPQRRPETIRMLADAGFVFPKPAAKDLAVHITLSPSACVAASLSLKGTISLRRMEYVFGDIGQRCTESNGSQNEICHISTAAAAALALTHSRACAQQRSPDDVFAIITPSHGSLRREFTRQALLTMMLSLDHNGSSDSPDQIRAMLRVPALFKILGAHYTLQLGRDGSRLAETKVSWVILNLKLVLAGLGSMGLPPGPLRPGLGGMFKYTLDLAAYTILDVDDLSREVEIEYRNQKRGPGNPPWPQVNPNEIRMVAFEQLDLIQIRLLERRSAGLLILLCSMSRSMLLSATKLIRSAYGMLIHRGRETLQIPNSGVNNHIWKVISDLFSTFPINLQSTALIELLTSIEQGVQACYNAQQGVDRAAVEREMLLAGTIPSVLLPVVKRLLASDLPKFLSSSVVDRARLCALDLSWLGLFEDLRTRESREGSTLASLPTSLCRVMDHQDGTRPTTVRLNQMYPAAVSSFDQYLKWQSLGGNTPTIPNFPLWAMKSPPRRFQSCWLRCVSVCPEAGDRFIPSFDSLSHIPRRPGSPIAPASAPVTGPAPIVSPPILSGPLTGPLTGSPNLLPSLKRKRSFTVPLGNRASPAEELLIPQEALPVRPSPSIPFLSRPPRNMPLDIILKQRISLPAPMRRCVRCGSVSEDMFWVMSSSARVAVARDAAGVVSAAKTKIALKQKPSIVVLSSTIRNGGVSNTATDPSSSFLASLSSSSSSDNTATVRTSNPVSNEADLDAAIFFIPPRIVPKHLMFEQGWMVHASRSCVCTGEWAKII